MISAPPPNSPPPSSSAGTPNTPNIPSPSNRRSPAKCSANPSFSSFAPYRASSTSAFSSFAQSTSSFFTGSSPLFQFAIPYPTHSAAPAKLSAYASHTDGLSIPSISSSSFFQTRSSSRPAFLQSNTKTSPIPIFLPRRAVFHAMENFLPRFPRHGSFSSTGGKSVHRWTNPIHRWIIFRGVQ